MRKLKHWFWYAIFVLGGLIDRAAYRMIRFAAHRMFPSQKDPR